MRLTKLQQRALFNLWKQSALRRDRVSYLAFRRAVYPEWGGGGCIMVPFCGMQVGIETDGYTHS